MEAAVFLELLGQHHAADRERGHCNDSIQHLGSP
jgi:hypothetical protein